MLRKEMKKITIVVPIYNVAPYIQECLESVTRQSYKGSIECLLIDDCGTDNSMDVVRNFLDSYKGNVDFKIYKHERNKGLSAARNTGLNHASGEYIFFLDSDDEITDDCLEKLERPIHCSTFDFVIGGYKVVGLKNTAPPLLLKTETIVSEKTLMKDYYEDKWYMMVCGKLCNVDFLRSNSLYFKEGLLHEDELWSFQLACLAKTMYVVNEECYIYKIRSGSITMNPKTQERRVVAFQKIMTYMIDFVIDKQIKDKYACLKIISLLNILNEALPRWSNLSTKEQKAIIRKQRKELSRLPYSMRLKSCLISLKRLVLDGAVLLPVSLYNIYMDKVVGLLRLLKKIRLYR